MGAYSRGRLLVKIAVATFPVPVRERCHTSCVSAVGDGPLTPPGPHRYERIGGFSGILRTVGQGRNTVLLGLRPGPQMGLYGRKRSGCFRGLSRLPVRAAYLTPLLSVAAANERPHAGGSRSVSTAKVPCLSSERVRDRSHIRTAVSGLGSGGNMDPHTESESSMGAPELTSADWYLICDLSRQEKFDELVTRFGFTEEQAEDFLRIEDEA